MRSVVDLGTIAFIVMLIFFVPIAYLLFGSVAMADWLGRNIAIVTIVYFLIVLLCPILGGLWIDEEMLKEITGAEVVLYMFLVMPFFSLYAHTFLVVCPTLHGLNDLWRLFAENLGLLIYFGFCVIVLGVIYLIFLPLPFEFYNENNKVISSITWGIGIVMYSIVNYKLLDWVIDGEETATYYALYGQGVVEFLQGVGLL